jgi:hypothetical protein
MLNGRYLEAKSEHGLAEMGWDPPVEQKTNQLNSLSNLTECKCLENMKYILTRRSRGLYTLGQ